jgi:hypothetical protein
MRAWLFSRRKTPHPLLSTSTPAESLPRLSVFPFLAFLDNEFWLPNCQPHCAKVMIEEIRDNELPSLRQEVLASVSSRFF